MVPLSHSEQVVSMFHQPLQLDWPQSVEFILKLMCGRSGPTPLHQLQHSFTAELQEPPRSLQRGLCKASPAQPSTHGRSAWGGRDEQALLSANQLQAPEKGPWQGSEPERALRTTPGKVSWVLQKDCANTLDNYCRQLGAPSFATTEQSLLPTLLQWPAQDRERFICDVEIRKKCKAAVSIYWVFTVSSGVPRSFSHL